MPLSLYLMLICTQIYSEFIYEVPNVFYLPVILKRGRVLYPQHLAREEQESSLTILMADNNPKHIQTHNNSSQKFCLERNPQLKYLWFLQDLSLIHPHIEKN